MSTCAAKGCANLLNPGRRAGARACSQRCSTRLWGQEHPEHIQQRQRGDPRKMSPRGRAVSFSLLHGLACGVCGGKAPRSLNRELDILPVLGLPDHCRVCGLRLCIDCRAGIGLCVVCARVQAIEDPAAREMFQKEKA